MGRGSSTTESGSAILFGQPRRRGAHSRRRRTELSRHRSFKPTLSRLRLKEYVEDLDGFCGSSNWLAAGSIPEDWKYTSAKKLWSDKAEALRSKLTRWHEDIVEGKAIDCEIGDVEKKWMSERRFVTAPGRDERWQVAADSLEAATRVATAAGREPTYFRLLPDSGQKSPWLTDERPNGMLVGFDKIDDPVLFVPATLERNRAATKS